MANGGNSKFGVLIGARRVWAVGAAHGHADQLRAVHDQIERRFENGDRLVYLGNNLGVSAAVRDTVDELLLFRRALLARFTLFRDDVVFLRGRQEEMWHKMLQLHLARDPAQVLEWMLAQGVGETLRAYGGSPDLARQRCREGALALARWTGNLREAVRANPGHDELAAALRRAAVNAESTILFVHAGIDVNRPLAAQTDSFWWGAAGFAEISEPYDGFRRIVRGYDPDHGGLRVGQVAATIDSGCGFGGPLTAACFDPSGDLVDRVES